jgi:voltage-dependent potassium channel beta subunit
MIYRRLGNTGLKVSGLSYGTWVNFDQAHGLENAVTCLKTAFEGGINFFDCAESYARGEAETILGQAIAELGWRRDDYVISTKFFFGIDGGVNSSRTLNRKYLLSAIDRSLERLGHEMVDLVFCHRPDPQTPIEEVVWTMSDIIASGKALYWGVSEWSAKSIRKAYQIADRHHLRAPVTEQPQYNLLARQRVEREYKDLYKEYGLGLTTWSPLASGVLTGKYLNGVPGDSRVANTDQRRTKARVQDETLRNALRQLQPIARQLGCSLAQLSIAWCLKNPRVSTVITGASRPSQVQENLGALSVIERLDDETMARIDAVFPRSSNFAG